ncbi:hypothetical protein [Streptomyces odonnellii]|uniref:hypothetical protein n=1 Tax=Streptomyces odonnellii TaxID=1417980 RepID=UPI0012FF53F6|nr:hypothetical protein [Streptomyces odonnellii]
MTPRARTRKYRVASAIGVLAAVIGLTAGVGATTASAASTSIAKKCFVDFYYEGHWTTVEVECG